MDVSASGWQLHQLVLAVQGHRTFMRRQPRETAALQAALLHHAASTVPHFAYLPDGAAHRLAAFRPIGREDISATRASFLSRQFGPRDWVDERTTSGTSGTPLRVVRDLASFYSFVYHTYARVFERIPELAGRARSGACAVLVVNDNPQRDEQTFINPSLDYALVRRVVIGRGPQQDQAALALAVQTAAPLLYGRPRSLVRMAELYRDSGQAQRQGALAPRAVLSSGDNLYRNDRLLLEQVFAAPVYNAYGSQEGGLVGMECQSHDGMHVLADAAFVEVLVDGCPEPQAQGHGELIVTSLENWAMPFIRYRTGDVATLTAGTCSCGHVGASIAAIDGRHSVYFSVGGQRFNPSVLNPIFEALPINQFQVVQDQSGALAVDWVGVPCADTHHTEAAMRRALAGAVGTLPTTIRRVDVIGAQQQKVQRYVRLQQDSAEPAARSPNR